MSKNIKTRKGKDGFNYPYTSPDLVVDSTGESQTTKNNNMKTDIQTLKDNEVTLVKDETSMEGIKDSEYPTLTTTDKTLIGSINEVNSQYKDIANKVFSTVNEMVNSKIKLGEYYKTLGYRYLGDGGGGLYIATNEAPNGYNIIKKDNNLSLKLIEEKINFKQLGGVGDGKNHLLSEYFNDLESAKAIYPNVTSLTDFTINDAILSTAFNEFKYIYFSSGVYCFAQSISIPENKYVYGEGVKQTYIKQIKSSQAITINGSYVNLENLAIVSDVNNKLDYGLVINKDCNFCKLENIIVQYFKNGIRINPNSFILDMINVCVYNCTSVGIDIADSNNILNIDKCKINSCGTGIQCVKSRNLNIINSWIELCDIGILKADNGNINIIDCYFERNSINSIKIKWGVETPELVIIKGCSFFTNNSNSMINYHAAKNSKLIVDSCYFIEYDLDDSIQSKVFEKGTTSTTIVPIFKNCYIKGGMEIGLVDGEYSE